MKKLNSLRSLSFYKINAYRNLLNDICRIWLEQAVRLAKPWICFRTLVPVAWHESQRQHQVEFRYLLLNKIQRQHFLFETLDKKKCVSSACESVAWIRENIVAVKTLISWIFPKGDEPSIYIFFSLSNIFTTGNHWLPLVECKSFLTAVPEDFQKELPATLRRSKNFWQEFKFFCLSENYKF